MLVQMIHTIVFLCACISVGSARDQLHRGGGYARLTAVHYSLHAQKLYEELKRKSKKCCNPLYNFEQSHPNTDSLAKEKDTEIFDPHLQLRICQDITGSGFFHLLNLIPNDIRRIYYNWSTGGRKYLKYHFPKASANAMEEHVFTCPFNESPHNDSVTVYPYYVSKEYDVGALDGAYKPGRFVFGINVVPGRRSAPYILVMLAEEPAVVYGDPQFNVELFYLQTRKYVEPGEIEACTDIPMRDTSLLHCLYGIFAAESNDVDPLCKHVSDRIRDPENQHYRLCVAVSRSSSFKDKIMYPRPAPSSCSKMQISFRTASGTEEAAGQSYYERMTLCYSTHTGLREKESFLYISRAYSSNQVLVYSRDSSDGKIYLENLSTNVSLVDGVNSFDFIED